MENKWLGNVVGALVGGLVAWLAAGLVFGFVRPQLFPAPAVPLPTAAKVVGMYLVLAAALLLAAQALRLIGGGAQRQSAALFWLVLGAEVVLRIGRAVEFPHQHPISEALFSSVSETLCLLAGGYVMARWFLNPRTMNQAVPAA